MFFKLRKINRVYCRLISILIWFKAPSSLESWLSNYFFFNNIKFIIFYLSSCCINKLVNDLQIQSPKHVKENKLMIIISIQIHYL